MYVYIYIYVYIYSYTHRHAVCVYTSVFLSVCPSVRLSIPLARWLARFSHFMLRICVDSSPQWCGRRSGTRRWRC